MGILRALALALTLTIGATGSVLAQDDAESQTSATRRIAPEACVSEPRPYEEIASILALDGDGLPAPARTQISPPLGELADAATTTAIGDTAREVIACFNAGDIPRGAALMTDNGIQRVFWGLTIDQENRDLAQVRIPGPPERRADEFLIRVTAVTDVTMLPDGRAAAFVVMSEPLLPPGGAETMIFVFANEDGTWLLDDLIDFTIVSMNSGE
jgi:hypothetical protein